jgi:hypothetical protein
MYYQADPSTMPLHQRTSAVGTAYDAHMLAKHHLQFGLSNEPPFIAGYGNLFCVLCNNQGLFPQTVNTVRKPSASSKIWILSIFLDVNQLPFLDD